MPQLGATFRTFAAIACVAACQAEPERPAAAAEPTGQTQAGAGPTQVGVASYYARELAGERTASGERHDPEAMTAASRSLPLGATAQVTNTATGRSVTVEVNDRGPYAKGRILDVSRGAAERLGFKDEGVAKVAVTPLTPTRARANARSDASPRQFLTYRYAPTRISTLRRPLPHKGSATGVRF